jgi:hypothetical protein
LSYRLVAKGSAADQQQNGASTERYVLAPSLNWKISDSTNLLLQAYLQKTPAPATTAPCPITAPWYRITAKPSPPASTKAPVATACAAISNTLVISWSTASTTR